jgi:hypothetical protein
VLDSDLPPESKITLAPALLAGVGSDDPRGELSAAVDRRRADFEGDERAAYDELAQRADDTLVHAVEESFRWAFLIAGLVAIAAAALVLPSRERLAPLLRAGAVALAVPLLYIALDAAIGPEPVDIADPCHDRALPGSPGLGGVIQDEALTRLDDIACHFGSSREELVLAMARESDAEEYEERYGANPRSASDVVQGLLGP